VYSGCRGIVELSIAPASSAIATSCVQSAATSHGRLIRGAFMAGVLGCSSICASNLSNEAFGTATTSSAPRM
jgi:hypothetical protein